MSDGTVVRFPGDNSGFSVDDKIAREKAQRGTPLFLDGLAMTVRKSYRAGRPEHRGNYSGPEYKDADAMKQRLQEIFPTSFIYCAPDPSFPSHMQIVVRFPQ